MGSNNSRSATSSASSLGSNGSKNSKIIPEDNTVCLDGDDHTMNDQISEKIENVSKLKKSLSQLHLGPKKFNPDVINIHSYFPPSLIQAQLICQENETIREEFAEYIMSMNWMKPFLETLRNQVNLEHEVKEVEEIALNEYILSPRTPMTQQEGLLRHENKILAEKIKLITQLKIKESRNTNSQSFSSYNSNSNDIRTSDSRKSLVESCFSPEEIRLILIAILWPYFQRTYELENQVNMTSKSEHFDEIMYFDNHQKPQLNNSSSSSDINGYHLIKYHNIDPKAKHSFLSLEKSISRFDVSDKSPHSLINYPLSLYSDSSETRLSKFDEYCILNSQFSERIESRIPFDDSSREGDDQFIQSSSDDEDGESQQITTKSSNLKSMKRKNSLHILRIKRLFEQTINNCHKNEFIYHLASGYWIDRILHCIEFSHFPVSLAIAEQKYKGFPMVYVNQAFESLTQYKREELLGRSCNVLQSPITERSQINYLVQALSKGEGVKVALINKKKNEDLFCNLLALFPVYDCLGNYILSLGVQYNVTDDEASLRDIKLIEDFLLLIANVFRR